MVSWRRVNASIWGGAVQHRGNIEALQRGGQKPNGAEFRGASTDPIEHSETFEPTFVLRDFIELRFFAGDSNGVPPEVQTGLVIGSLRFQHSVAGFFGAARFRDHNRQRIFQIIADFGERAFETVGIGVIEKVRVHFVAARPRQSVGDELRAKRRTADADNEQMLEFAAARRHDFASVNLRCKTLNFVQNRRDLRAQIVGRQLRIAQPVMADSAFFVGIGDGATLQFVHLRIGFLQFRLEIGEEVIAEIHARNVERKT